MTDITWGVPTLAETNALLAEHHYLGPSKSGGKHLFGGWVDGKLVAAQVWRSVTARRLNSPAILELSRWCLTPPAGANAGSRMHKYAVAELRKSSEVEILVSYSDPSAGHGGSLYRACNWLWAPTWHRLRPPPSGLGSWGDGVRQEVKDRWVFPVQRRPDPAVVDLFRVTDRAAIRKHLASPEYAEVTHRWLPLVPWADYEISKETP